jgi:hypothetical protein
MHVSQFSGNLVDARGFDTKTLISRQSFTGELQQDAFEDRGRHFSSDSTGLPCRDWISFRAKRGTSASTPPTKKGAEGALFTQPSVL